MRYDVESTLLDAVYVSVPAVPMDAIRGRAERRIVRGRTRRNAFAALAAAISIAVLAFVARVPQTAHVHAPAPIASNTPAPAITARA